MTEQQLDRFWRKVFRSSPNECWAWSGAKDQDGYGLFWLAGSMKRAHRVSMELENGAIAEGLVVDHICRNRSCVNPSHLRTVTRYTNVHENSEAPAHLNSLKTTCVNGHPLEGANLVFNGKRRRCRECEQSWREAYQAKQVTTQPRYPVVECAQGHPMTGDNLVIKANGNRRCRQCHVEMNRKYRANRKVGQS